MISGNEDAIEIGGAGTDSNLIYGNLIGTDATGTQDKGNLRHGVVIYNGVQNTQVGGTGTGQGNVISGNNDSGIVVDGNGLTSGGNSIVANLIGVQADGTSPLGNTNDGIQVFGSADNVLIGSTTAGKGNVIANNALGILVETGSTGISIVGNSIHDNTAEGIDLAASTTPDGVSTNDLNDADGGGNLRQNYPLITQADLSGTNLTVSGSLDTDGATTQYRIEFFGNAAGTQDATNGEGRFYLGTTTVTTNGSGDATFSGVVLTGVTLAAGDFVTATATKIDAPAQVGVDDQLAYGCTSEFAANVVVTQPPNQAPVNSIPVLTANVLPGTVNGPATVASGDFNGDGFMDIVAGTLGDASSASLSWYQNDGSQNFVQNTITTVGMTADLVRDVAVEDIDGDGDLDIVSASQSDNRIAWWSNDGLGNFTQNIVSTTLVSPRSVVTADFDGDGDMDIIAGGRATSPTSAPTIIWFDNDGSEVFTARTVATLSTIGQVTSIAIADMDGDADLDIVAAGFSTDNFVWFEHQGAGSFVTHTIDSGATVDGAAFVSVADIDGDGDQDVATAAQYANVVSWYKNDGTGNFGAGPEWSIVANGARSVFAADLENDGDVDIVAGSVTDQTIIAHINDGAATPGFTAQTISSTSAYPLDLHMADIDGDTDLDLLEAAYSPDDQVRWYENQGGFQTTADTLEDTALTFSAANGNLISISDADAGGASVQVTLTATNGTVTLAQTAGLTITPPADGTDDATIEFTGTVADINAALDGLTFTPTSDFVGAANLEINTNDLGNTGTGGAKSDIDQVSINVISVNDAHTLGNGSLTAVNEDTASPAGDTVSTIFSGQFGDVDAGSTMSGIAVIGNLANVGTEGSWQYSTNGGTNWFDIGTVADDNTALAISSGTLIRFVPAGNYDGAPTGLIVRGLDNSYVAGFSDTSGSETRVNVDTTSNGGTTAIAAASANLNTSITAVNNAPTHGAGNISAIWEDDTDPPGETVGNLWAGTFNDPDAGSSLAGVAITSNSAPGTQGVWEYSTDAGTTWYSIGAASDAASVVFDTTTLLRFLPAADFSGNPAVLTSRVLDNTYAGAFTSGATIETISTSSNGGTTPISSTLRNVSSVVLGVNDAPVETAIEGANLAYTENDAATQITNTIAIADVDDTNIESAVVQITANYVNGEDVLAFADLGPIVGSWNATLGTLTLTGSDTLANYEAALRTITYQNASDDPSESTRTVSFTVNDGSLDGNTLTRDIVVTATNDAPVLDASGTMTLTGITEDNINNGGNTVASIIASATGDRITDVDSADPEGIAITAFSGANGTWEYSIDGGSNWNTIAAATNNALLLRDTDLVRFNPDGTNAVTASIDFKAWDQSAGTAGGNLDATSAGGTTPFSLLSETATITVTDVNDAPTITNAGTVGLPGTDEDSASAGTAALTIVNNVSWADVDSGAVRGMAVTSITGNGTWEYSTDAVTWNSFGAVSATNALLLSATTQVRYVGDGANGEVASFGFRAWDATTSTASTNATPSYANPGAGGGTSEFSSESATANTTVTSVNDAPVLGTAGLPQLTSVLQNAGDPNGDFVSAIIASAGGDPITDVDSGAVEGIAVTSVDNTNGTWQYSTNGGSTWTNFGAVTDATAVVLTDTANDMIRFVPGFNYTGNATISYRAWDTTDGSVSGDSAVNTGATTAFSTATESASIYVEPAEVLLWLSTTSDIGPAYFQDPSGVPGLDSWSDGTVVGMGDPNLSFGSGTTTGTFSAVTNFDAFAADFNVDITGLHYVTNDITVTGAGIATGSIDLLAGDVIFVTQAGETLSSAASGAPAGWSNNMVTTAGDINVFRAEYSDDYSSGYFRLLMNDPSVIDTAAITLVESATTVGDTVLAAGDFLFVDNFTKSEIKWYDTSLDSSATLIEGNQIGINDAIQGLELVESSTTVGGVALATGNILATIDKADTTVGSNNLSVAEHDVFALNVTATTFGSGTAAATASMLFDGDGNVNFDATGENLDALSLILKGSGTNQAPVLGNSGAAVDFVEDGSPTIVDGTIIVADADSTDFAGGTLSVGITAGGATGDRLSIWNQGTGAGQIGVSGDDVTYAGTIIGTFSGGLNSGSPLGIQLECQCRHDIDASTDAEHHVLEHVGQSDDRRSHDRFHIDRR